MSKANALGLMYGLAGMLAAGSNYGEIDDSRYITDSDLQDARIKQQENERKHKLKNGLKPFTQNGITVWARNEKNGLRKLKNALKGI